MDDEFKLCWKNFQDNIASGFQNLYDRGDLVDVTLACDGKLLHAHKIVLAICSPYFQEIFITNPCKHPIIILKDVTFNIMCELLEFMYQGVVNVKHTELQSFMKIGQLLQIKGLATNSSSSAASTSSEKSSSQVQNLEEAVNTSGDAPSSSNAKNAAVDREAGNADNSNGSKPTNMSSAPAARAHTPTSSPSPMGFSTPLSQQNFKNSAEGNVAPLHHSYHASGAYKRQSADFGSEALSVYSRKQFRRSAPSSDHNSEHNDNAETGMDQVNPEDFFLPAIPHISMVESRYDLNNVKRESEHHTPATVLRNSFPTAFGFDYNLFKNTSNSAVGSVGGGNNSGTDYPNDLHMPSDYSKNFGNHMDIPAIAPGEHWWQGKLEFMLSQRGKPLLVHDGHTFGIQYVRKDKKYWQCNLSRKFNCKARVTTTDTGEIIVTNNEHCHTEIRQHLRKDYQRNKVMMNALMNLSTNRLAENLRRHTVNASLSTLGNLQSIVAHAGSSSTAVRAPATGTTVHDGLLDLGKPTNAMAVNAAAVCAAEDVVPPKAHVIEEDDVPLDCGMRSVSSDGAAKKPTDASRDHNRDESGWKCKNEQPGSQ